MSRFSWENVLVTGTAAGAISGLVKLGWENILPPRTPKRDKTNPPQKLLEQMGVPTKLTHATYTYSDEKLPWVNYLAHFGLSISFVAIYAALLEKKVKWLTVDRGVPFGLAVWIAFCLVVIPLMKTVPPPKDQPLEGHVSEALSYIVQIWASNEIAEVILE